MRTSGSTTSWRASTAISPMRGTTRTAGASHRSPIHADARVAIGADVRRLVTRDRLRGFMKELSRSVPDRASHRVYLVGGSTALLAGFRESTVDVDVYSPDDRVFRDIQGIKERLDMNIEFARPEEFVPALAGTSDRHLFIERVG